MEMKITKFYLYSPDLWRWDEDGDGKIEGLYAPVYRRRFHRVEALFEAIHKVSAHLYHGWAYRGCEPDEDWWPDTLPALDQGDPIGSIARRIGFLCDEYVRMELEMGIGPFYGSSAFTEEDGRLTHVTCTGATVYVVDPDMAITVYRHVEDSPVDSTGAGDAVAAILGRPGIGRPRWEILRAKAREEYSRGRAAHERRIAHARRQWDRRRDEIAKRCSPHRTGFQELVESRIGPRP